MKPFKLGIESLEVKQRANDRAHFKKVFSRVVAKYNSLHNAPPKFSRDYIVFTNFWWQYYDATVRDEFPKHTNWLQYKNFYQKYPKFVDKLKLIILY